MFIFCHWYGIFEKGATKQTDSDYRKILKGALDMLKVSGKAEIKIGLEIFQKNNICENSSTSFKASFTDPDMIYCQGHKV